jgi:hypothetical protein
MFAKIVKKILPVVLSLGLAAVSKADDLTFPFTYTVQTGQTITATGSFTTDNYGPLGINDFTAWSITFTSPSLGNEPFILTKDNSNLTIGQDTTINAIQSPQNLKIDALDQNGGFGVAGQVTDATGTWNVEWDYANGGPFSIMRIGLVGTPGIAGFTNLTFPSSFETAQLSDVQPVPEPSSLLLLGTGGLSLAAASLRKIRNRPTQE